MEEIGKVISQIAHRITAVALLVLVSIVLVGCVGETERSKAGQLKEIAARTPVYPGFKKTDEKVVLKPNMVYLFTYYTTSSQFQDVKAFYDRVLVQQGWGQPEQSGPSIVRSGQANWVRYRRDDFSIVVEQDERNPNTFDVVFEWAPR